MEELKDIKGIIEVPDYSFFILIGIIVFTILFIIFLVYFLKNKRRKRKKLTTKQIAMNNLKAINFKNTKDTVYTFCENFQYFINENNKEQFELLQKELEVFKYKKNIDELSEDFEDKIKNMIKDIK